MPISPVPKPGHLIDVEKEKLYKKVMDSLKKDKEYEQAEREGKPVGILRKMISQDVNMDKVTKMAQSNAGDNYREWRQIKNLCVNSQIVGPKN